MATQWANGLDFSELPGHLRHRAVRLAAEACLVQLLITGFIHADPHEGRPGGVAGVVVELDGVGWSCLDVLGWLGVLGLTGW